MHAPRTRCLDTGSPTRRGIGREASAPTERTRPPAHAQALASLVDCFALHCPDGAGTFVKTMLSSSCRRCKAKKSAHTRWGALVSLSLVKSQLGAEGLKLLGPALVASASPLAKVDLRTNGLGEAAARTLQQSLQHREGLELHV